MSHQAILVLLVVIMIGLAGATAASARGGGGGDYPAAVGYPSRSASIPNALVMSFGDEC
jgi:hypothetical protein